MQRLLRGTISGAPFLIGACLAFASTAVAAVAPETLTPSASGVTMLVAPGPEVTMATPGRPVAWAKPSAMWPAPCSCRGRMVRIFERVSDW